MNCEACGVIFDPAEDFFITINERKARSVNVCSTACLNRWLA